MPGGAAARLPPFRVDVWEEAGGVWRLLQCQPMPTAEEINNCGRGAVRWQGQRRTHVSKPSSAKASACFASPAEPPLKKHAMEAFLPFRHLAAPAAP